MYIFLYLVNYIIGDAMYYINSFLLYSVLGFIMESCLYKIMSIDNYSGFMYGPVTPVYGVGVIFILLIHKYIIEKMRTYNIIKIIITFIVCCICLTIIEFVGGFLLEKIFDIELWNYSDKKYNFGKYICLEISIAWGLVSVFFIYIVKPFMDKFIKRIPRKATYLFICLFFIDLCLVFIKHFS